MLKKGIAAARQKKEKQFVYLYRIPRKALFQTSLPIYARKKRKNQSLVNSFYTDLMQSVCFPEKWAIFLMMKRRKVAL